MLCLCTFTFLRWNWPSLFFLRGGDSRDYLACCPCARDDDVSHVGHVFHVGMILLSFRKTSDDVFGQNDVLAVFLLNFRWIGPCVPIVHVGGGDFPGVRVLRDADPNEAPPQSSRMTLVSDQNDVLGALPRLKKTLGVSFPIVDDDCDVCHVDHVFPDGVPSDQTCWILLSFQRILVSSDVLGVFLLHLKIRAA